jgi:hypothetical protein
MLLRCDPPVLTANNSDILCAKAILSFCDTTFSGDTATILGEDCLLEKLNQYIDILPALLMCKTVILTTNDYIYATYTKPKPQLFLLSPIDN